MDRFLRDFKREVICDFVKIQKFHFSSPVSVYYFHTKLYIHSHTTPLTLLQNPSYPPIQTPLKMSNIERRRKKPSQNKRVIINQKTRVCPPLKCSFYHFIVPYSPNFLSQFPNFSQCIIHTQL